jgi:hypothetical protein
VNATHQERSLSVKNLRPFLLRDPRVAGKDIKALSIGVMVDVGRGVSHFYLEICYILQL